MWGSPGYRPISAPPMTNLNGGTAAFIGRSPGDAQFVIRLSMIDAVVVLITVKRVYGL